jgi:hypothetical protein
MSSVSNSLLAGQFQIAVAKQQLESIEQQGRDALTLIDSSIAPQAAVPAAANVGPGVGTTLNIVG